MPKPLPNRVLVRYLPTGHTKEVLRSQLPQLGKHWERVPVLERTKKRPARQPLPVEPKTPTDPATTADKED